MDQKLISSNPFYITPEELKAHLKPASLRKDSGIDSKEMFVPEKLFPGLDTIGKIFQLSDFEKKALLVILAPEIDPQYERMYGYLQDDLNRKYPTMALISFLLCENNSERLHVLSYFQPQSPLLKFGLIKFVNVPTETSFLFRPLKIQESVKDFVLGLYSLDSQLGSFCKITAPLKAKSISSKAKSLTNSLRKGIKESERFLIHFHGPPGAGKRKLALEVASELGFGGRRVEASDPGQGVANVMIAIVELGKITNTKTDAEGCYRFSGLKRGTYTFKASTNGREAVRTIQVPALDGNYNLELS